MKRSILLIIVCLASLPSIITAQTKIVDMGIFNNPLNTNKLEIRVKTILTVVNAPLSAGVFTVRYPHTYGVTLSVFSTPYGYTIAAQDLSGADGYDYYAFSFAAGYTVNWTSGVEYVVAVLQHGNEGSGTGTFELITNNAWTISHNSNYYFELNGQSRARQFYQNIATNVPLPVELLAFTATALTDRTIDLDWIAATERDMAFYGVEYSADGHKFSQLDQVTAAGTTSVATTYTYLHSTPQPGTNYYRLRMVNTDGTFEYSPIRSAELDGQRHHFSLVPTPTTGPLALMSQHLEQYPDGLRYKLTDNSGKLLQTDVIRNEKTDFNLSAYAAGFYYLTVFTDQEQLKQFKVIVTKD